MTVASPFGRRAGDEFDTVLYDWLRKKNLDADRLTLGVTEFTPTTVGTLSRLDRQDNTVVSRFRLTEVRAVGAETHTWQSEILAYEHADGTGEFLIHVNDPRRPGANERLGPTGVPGLVRLLVDSSTAMDGTMQLRDGPTVLTAEDEDLVHEMIVDEERRGLLILAPTPVGRDVHEFARAVKDLTFGTVGQAGTYVLAPDLVAALHGHTSYLFLPPGGMRMVPPGTDPASKASVANSYYLTGERLNERDPKRVERHWTWLAREHGNSAPWPKHLQRVMRLITEHERNTLIDELDAFLARRPAPRHTQPTEEIPEAIPETNSSPITDQPTAVDTTVVASPVLPAAPSVPAATTEEALRLALEAAMPTADILAKILHIGGCSTVTDSLELAIELAGEYDGLRDIATSLSGERASDGNTDDDFERLLELQDEVSALRAEKEEAEARLDQAVRGASWLREQLTTVGRADLAWSAPTDVDLAQDFDTVLEVIAGLTYVTFTGNKDTVTALDDMKGSTAAAKSTHRALLALNDYARAKADGVWDSGGFVDYLNDQPAGYASISHRKVAAKESDQVAQNPSFRRHRELLMPDGTVQYMEAHVKLSQEASVSPRMHFFDDTARSRIIVVGYIGPHLPNTRTN